MKFCFGVFTVLLLAVSTGHSQLVNNGATIKVQAGALLFCSGDVQNNTGIINNDGRIEVQGSFTNAATYTSDTNEDSLIMSGGNNVTLNGGASTLSHLYINKTANSNFVTLTGSTTVGVKLTYNSGTLSTDPIANVYTLNSPVSAAYQFTAGREIVGRVRRTGWANGAAIVFNQPNMQITTNTGTAPTEFTVNMIPETNGGDPSLAEREVKRKFVFTPVGGTGYTTDARFPYLTAELNTNTEGNLVPWRLPASEWLGRLTPVTRDGVNDWVSTTAIPTTEIGTEWKLADPKYTFNATVFLRGPFNTGTLMMNPNINSILPLSQPYTVTPWSYTGTESVGAIPNANIIDWVMVEFRKPASGLPADATSGTIVARRAGFLLNTGAVVDLDGLTPISVDMTKQGAGFMVIRHRNHLGVMSNSLPSNASGSYTNNFSVLANSYKPAGAPSDPVVLLTGTTYGLWLGDVNRSGVVNGTDVNVIKAAIANSLSGYLFQDANLSTGGSINGTDVNLTKTTIANSGTGGTPARPAGAIRTNIPDPITEQ